MAIRAPKPKSGGAFEPCPAGFFRAVCVDVHLMPQQDTPWGKKDKLMIAWQLDPESVMNSADDDWLAAHGNKGTHTVKHDDGTDEELPWLQHGFYNLSVHKKAGLRKMVEGWRGKKFADDDEAAEFDFENLIGVNANLQIQHNEVDKDGEKRTYSNVVAVIPPDKSQNQKPVGYVRKKERDNNGDGDIPF